MKTTYRTFTAWDGDAMAAGFSGTAGGERHPAMTCRPGSRVRRAEEDKVIDLNAWKAANPGLLQEEAGAPDWDGGEPDEPELVLPAPRARRDHRRAMCAAELAATLAVAGAALALALRVLMF